MKIYRNQTLDGLYLELETVTFIDCILVNCDLYYSGGDYEWVRTSFTDCRFHWRGPANNTARLMQSLNMLIEPTKQTIN